MASPVFPRITRTTATVQAVCPSRTSLLARQHPHPAREQMGGGAGAPRRAQALPRGPLWEFTTEMGAVDALVGHRLVIGALDMVSVGWLAVAAG